MNPIQKFKNFLIQRLEPTSPHGRNLMVNLPRNRVSKPNLNTDISTSVDLLSNGMRVADIPFERDIIRVFRKLIRLNPDVGQALTNVINLGNTGHRVIFDSSVPESQVLKMREHLDEHAEWAAGQAGPDGLTNKLMTQLMIAGAVSLEAVPNNDLSGIKSIVLVNPEDIYWILKSDGITYEPYQKVQGFEPHGLNKLNPNTYKYYTINGDTELPYGYPPYMPSIKAICTQENMSQSINNIIDQLGLLGFMQVLLTAPDQRDGETDDQYSERLTSILTEAKQRVDSGIKDGTMVGYKDQIEFQFQSVARDFSKVVELWKQNELQVASGLKQDATLWGRDYNTSESQISIIFMKMLSEFKNMQNTLSKVWEFIYKLDLRLAGFNFRTLKVEFSHSTIQDDLKYQQAREIKIRNLKDEYLLGIISLEQLGYELNREEINQSKPRVDIYTIAGVPRPNTSGEAQKKEQREKDKDDSDKRVRDKNNPQGGTKKGR